MAASRNSQGSAGAVQNLTQGMAQAVARLARAPSSLHRDVARRRLLRQFAWLAAAGVLVILALMLTVDMPVIAEMPARGAPELWLARAITDCGNATYVLFGVGILLAAVAIAQPLTHARSWWAGTEIRIAFVFFAVAVANLIGEVFKGAIGRARPFVGGHADAFHFSPLTWHEPFESLPSAHAITAVALAAAVGMAWPRTRFVMALYAVLIMASRVALLAHHPSDVVAGALVAIVGTLLVRHWFALRRLGFTIDEAGRVSALSGPAT